MRGCEVAGNVFIKRSECPSFTSESLKNESLIQRLERRRLIPPVLLMTENPQDQEYQMIMERVYGFGVDAFPPYLDEYKYSLGFAKNLANIFTGLHEEGAYHRDIHGGNIMYDERRNRFVFVDLEELTDTIPGIEQYTFDYSRVMMDAYTGIDVLMQIKEVQGVAEKTKSVRLEDFCARYDADEELVWLIRESSGLTEELIDIFELSDRIHPGVVDFIACGMQYKGASFDEIGAL